jgi:serine/threonine protein kinase/tetratricopeptide (TPR) repeat protein
MESWSGKDITAEIWEKVKPLFDAASNMKPELRAAFLAQNCPDLNVRAEVERLLASHDKAGAFLAEPPVDGLPLFFEQPRGHSLQPGTLLAGRFKILSFVAQGGMGEVYEVEDLELHEHLGIKTLRSELLQQANAIERFKREVHLARKVTHPNVCRVFDLFRDRSSNEELVFVTMEFLRGETLAHFLRRHGRMSLEESLPLIKQMASGLSAAHRAGIVHRDFKPGNVVLVDEASGRVVITDFGLAFRPPSFAEQKTLGEGSWEPITGKGEFHGTPAYMAPEQIEGYPATAASDIYAFGLVIFEMVTGVRPFSGTTPMSMAAKRLVEPPPTPKKFDPELSTACESAILRCLDRDPSKRFAEPEDVANALVSDQLATRQKDTDPLPAYAPKHSKRSAVLTRYGLAITAAVVLLLVGLATRRQYLRKFTVDSSMSSGAGRAIKVRPSVAVIGFKNLSRKPDADWLSLAFSETLTTELAAGEKLRTVAGERVTRTKADLSLSDEESYAQDTLAKLGRTLDTDYVVIGSYLPLATKTGAEVRLDVHLQDTRTGDTIASVSETGTSAHLLDLIERTGAELRNKLGVGGITGADAIGVRASLPSDPMAARFYAEGLKRQRLHDAQGARDSLERAIAIEPGYLLAHSALAECWIELGYEDNAKTEAKKAFDLSANLSREERLSVEARFRQTRREWGKAAELYGNLFNLFPDNLQYGLDLANAQRGAGKENDALATIDRLRKLPAPTGEDPGIDLIEARIAQVAGDFKRQEAIAVTAVTKAQALGAPLLEANALLEVCGALKDRGQFNEARAACLKAEETFARTGDRHGVAVALIRQGLAAYGQGNLDEGRTFFEQALTNATHISDNLNAAAALNNIAMILSAKGDHVGAEQRYQQSLAVNRRINRAYGIQLVLGNIASELSLSGRLDDARTKYDDVLRAVRDMHQEASESSNLVGLGTVLYLQGHLDESEVNLKRALDICRRIGSKQTCADALEGLGQVYESRGQLNQAESLYEQSLAVKTAIGNETGAAESKIFITNISLQQGHAADAEPVIRGAREVFRQQKNLDDEVSSDSTLIRAFLIQGKLTQARKETTDAAKLASRLQNEEVRLRFSLANASALAASGTVADRAAAVKILQDLLRVSSTKGYVGCTFEARLALGEVEMKTGHDAAGRARLSTLEEDARGKGFHLIADRAASALRG